MSERLNSHEQPKQHESHETGHHEQIKNPEINKAKHEKESKAKLEKAREATEKLASPSKKLAIEKDDAKRTHFGTHSIAKKETYKQLLKEIQRKLPKRSRNFSKIIHQKNIEAVSEMSAKTIARPSGLLGAGLGALAGTIIVLSYGYHYGFEYNNTVFLIMFAGGYLIGLFTELVMTLFKRRSR